MDAIIAAVRRMFGQHGEGLLIAATKELDKVVAKLEAAVVQVADEIAAVYEADDERRREYEADRAKSAAKLLVLNDVQARAQRVSKRISGLVE